MRPRSLVPILYILFLMLPIYWLVAMSFKTTNEILGGFSLFPQEFTLDNYRAIFTDPSWYWGYINSIIYVSLNTVISLAAALPAAYAFSRYRFVGDKHLFFWLLTNRMAPAAVFALPFFQLYSSVGLFDTHLAVALAHCLFNIPLAVWILEGFMSGVPKELDETAYVDGYSFPRFFITIFIPAIRAGVGVAAFFCFMFSWVELLLAKTLTAVEAQAHRGHHDPHCLFSGLRAGPAGCGWSADDHPWCDCHLLRPKLHCQGLRPGEGLMRWSVYLTVSLPAVAMAQGWGNVSKPKEEVFTWAKWWSEPLFSGFWMAWTRATLAFFLFIFGFIAILTVIELCRPGGQQRDGVLGLTTTRGDRLFIGLLGAAYIFLAWIGLVGTTLWIPLGIAITWLGFCFWKI